MSSDWQFFLVEGAKGDGRSLKLQAEQLSTLVTDFEGT